MIRNAYSRVFVSQNSYPTSSWYIVLCLNWKDLAKVSLLTLMLSNGNFNQSNIIGPFLSPILLHTSGPTEGHYHRLRNGKPILLHGHSSGPFVPLPSHLTSSYSKGLNLSIYSSGECGVKELSVTVDWGYSFSRWGPRYWNAILAWSAGIIGFMFCASLTAYDSGGTTNRFSLRSNDLDSNTFF